MSADAARQPNGREFTGRMFLAIIVSFFAVVIAVNLVMAYFANSTWSGLVVPNSYVASQEFNGKVAAAEAQLARGWQYKLAVAPGRVAFTLATQAGAPVSAGAVTVVFRRPVTDREDMRLELARDGDAWQAPATLADGAWIAEIDAEIGEAAPWRETLRFTVEGGVGP